MKKNIEEGQEKLKEEIKVVHEKMEVAQAQLKSEIEAVHEKMETTQAKLKEEIKAELSDNRRSFDDFKEELKNEEIQLKEEIEEKVGDQMRQIQGTMEDKFTEFDKIVKALGKREVRHSSAPSGATLRRILKLSTFDGQTSWRIFKMQFDVISESNNWHDVTKASHLIAVLRGSAAEALQTVPMEKLHDISTIITALESRFGEAHLADYHRAELKTRRQKANESLQELAANIGRLMHLAFPDTNLDTRESLAAQYFTDAIRDEDMQHALRLSDAKDLRSALVFAMKYESAKLASRGGRHVRKIALEPEEEISLNQMMKKMAEFNADILKKIDDLVRKNRVKNGTLPLVAIPA